MEFQSTLSLRRATFRARGMIVVFTFQSTLSLRRATTGPPPGRSRSSNFNPRSPCGERPPSIVVVPPDKPISIHALLAESDDGTAHLGPYSFRFQSTLSLRRATDSVMARGLGSLISIHALLAESDRSPTRLAGFRLAISIHALLAESDDLLEHAAVDAVDFNPRSPCGERPLGVLVDDRVQHISIHALLAESDRPPAPAWHRQSNFNPRSPCGERLQLVVIADLLHLFQSTLSLRRATPHGRQALGDP